ncbi:MAG: ion transporter [Lysobacterales bacterium]
MNLTPTRLRLARWVGLAGVAADESCSTHRWFLRFEWLLLPLALLLPLLWLLESHRLLSPGMAMRVDAVIWAVFLIETIAITAMVRDWRRYLRQNWMNLLIILSAPPLWLLGGHWLAGVLRLLRLLMVVAVLASMAGFARRLLARNRLGLILFVAFVVTSIGGVAVTLVDPAFAHVGDGIWWAWVTITTVGYGDVVPVTLIGRVFAVLLMLMGLGLIALISATLVTLFQEEEEREANLLRHRVWRKLQEMDREADQRAQHMELLLQRLSELEAIHRETHANHQRLMQKLDAIERQLDRSGKEIQ